MSDYDKIPVPKERCENCCNGTVHVTFFGDVWTDVFRCALDGGLKDYRVHCWKYEKRKIKSGPNA